jgi:hypothetical protein
LSQEGIWFRNAVTVESNTERSLPSILTGRRAIPGAVPVRSFYPDNLFTLLDGVYDIRAVEQLTELCPESTCADEGPASGQSDVWYGLATDLSIVSLHVLLPESVTDGLPPIDERWSGFGNDERSSDTSTSDSALESFSLPAKFDAALQRGRLESVDFFLDQLEVPSSLPTLDFVHLMLPHSPWEYLPSGERHGAPEPTPGKVGQGWGNDEWLVSQAYQRHLLQVQFVDGLVGEIIDLLQDAGRYDESLIIILADHGIVFRPNVESRRSINEGSVGEIAAVPLFVKLPHSSVFGIDDYRAELTDVLPTIADVIQVDVPWSMDGTSLLSESRPIRRSSVMNSGALVFGVDGNEKYNVARAKAEMFGEGSPFNLATLGTRQMLGRSTDLLGPVSRWDGATAIIEEGLSAPTSGTYIGGVVVGIGTTSDEPLVLGLAIEGVLVATTQTYVVDGQLLFQGMLPPRARLDIERELSVYVATPGMPDTWMRISVESG